ncbi:isochorismatase family protein [Hungatella hathewayi]|uniref:isochorismatase family protein n=1 Tax=Hungatella hathewayi TaxID=154046 RepID=UPI003568DCBB
MISSSPNLILKEKASVFSDPGLLELLHQHSVTEIEIIGIDGCCSVVSSAVAACKSGFHVTLPCEFIGVRNMTKFEERRNWRKMELPFSNETGGKEPCSFPPVFFSRTIYSIKYSILPSEQTDTHSL